MIPEGELSLELNMTNPPKPLGFHVRVAGQSVAVMRPEALREALLRYDRMLAEYNESRDALHRIQRQMRLK